MKRFTIGFVTVLTGAVLAACGSTAPTTTSPTSGSTSGTSATSAAGDMSATSAAGDMSATSAAGDMSATSSAGSTSATSMAGDMSATSAAGDMSATSAAGDMSATSSAGDMSATSAAGGTSATSTTDDLSSTAEAVANSLVDVASKQGDLTTIITALQATGLDKTLAQGGQYTLFAPSDEAFASLPAGTVQKLLADPQLLQQILTYHVAQGEIKAADVATKTSIPTVEGQPIQVSAQGGTVTLNNQAKVTITDIQTTNGVIHVIDKVLLPPNVTLPSGS